MVTDDEVLDKIIQFATACHGLQMRRYSDEKYIVHPIRVMEICKEYTTDIAILAAALLHDVLEDTPVTKAQIQTFLKQYLAAGEVDKTVQLVEELTDVFTKEQYPAWNRKKRKKSEVERLEQISADAKTIKYADIMDNTPEISLKDPHFAKVFLPECKNLLQKIPGGNAELYERAMATLNNCMRRKKLS